MMRRRSRAVGVVVLVATLSGCGPGGVQVGHDWQGAELLAISKVNGQRVVIGIYPAARRAESLIVIPSKRQDDPDLGPRILRPAGGPWLVTVPERQGASVLYRIDSGQEALVGIGAIAGGRSVLPAGPEAVLVAADSAAIGILDVASGRVIRTVGATVRPTFTADSAAPATLCAAQSGESGVEVATVALSTGRATSPTRLPATSVTALGCRGGRPLLVSSVVAQVGMPPESTVELREGTANGVDQLIVRGAVGAAVLTTANSIFLAVSDNARSEVVELDGRTGHQVRRIAVNGIPVVRGLYETAKGLVVVGDDRAAAIDATGPADEFRLPGPLIAAPDVASSR
jgi:hypothetical protein